MPRAAFFVSPYDRPKILVSVAALGVVLALSPASLAAFVSFAWPQHVPPPPGPVFAGLVGDFEVGQPVTFTDSRFHLVKKPDGSFVALSWKDPHLGCTVPWRPDFTFTDPRNGASRVGWFRNPCHGETYDAYGTRVFGPSPRDLNQLPAWVNGGKVYVDTNPAHIILGRSYIYTAPNGFTPGNVPTYSSFP